MFLIHRGDASGLGIADLAVAGVQLVKDQFEERGLADAIAAYQPDLCAHGEANAGMVKKPAAPGIEGEFVDLQHNGGGS